MKYLYIIKCYNKSGYPIGDYHVVASSERKAKADCEAINEYMKSIIIYWEAQYTPKRAVA